MKRVSTSIPNGLWKIIKEELMGKIGIKESEVIRYIVIAYLSEQDYFKNR